jgi:hypothetical protein
MLKKLLAAVVAGAVVKVVLDRMTGANSHDADLWAEATDDVHPAS